MLLSGFIVFPVILQVSLLKPAVLEKLLERKVSLVILQDDHMHSVIMEDCWKCCYQVPLIFRSSSRTLS